MLDDVVAKLSRMLRVTSATRFSKSSSGIAASFCQ
jgi:hypothetical protein